MCNSIKKVYNSSFLIAKKIVKRIYFGIKLRLKYVRIIIFVKEPVDCKQDIPIIINNFNQLDYLLKLLESLECRGYNNIIIIDNKSTYPPLLEYYKQSKHRIIYLDQNYGYLALWRSGVYKEFHNKYFVYTDPDVEISKDCPSDFLSHFYNIMRKHRLSSKVGFSLKIDDLPDYFNQKDKVITWEKQFWEKKFDNNLYWAPIDTTFALYRPYTKFGKNRNEFHIRVGEPYTMHHLPWYINSNQLTENMIYYINSCKTSTHWSGQMKDKNQSD